MGGVGGVLNTHENPKCRLFKFKLCMVFKKGGNPSANCLNSEKKIIKLKEVNTPLVTTNLKLDRDNCILKYMQW